MAGEASHLFRFATQWQGFPGVEPANFELKGRTFFTELLRFHIVIDLKFAMIHTTLDAPYNTT